MFGLISKKELKQTLREITRDNLHATGAGMDDFYFMQGVGDAVSFLCHRFKIRYEEIALPAVKDNLQKGREIL